MKTLHTLFKLMALPIMMSVTLCAPAGADNLYAPGTTPAKMFAVVYPVLGDKVTPIFFMGNDGQRFLNDLDPEAVKRAGVEQITIDQYYKALTPETRANGVLGYSLGGAKFSGNEKEEVTCGIVVADKGAMKTTSTMFHEAIHCKTFAELRKDKAAFALAVSFNKPGLKLTSFQFVSYYHEALAAFLQVAYDSNDGHKDGLGMIIRYSKSNKNTATSIGFRTARAALKLCGKAGSCPTDTPALVKMLSNNTDAMDAITTDMVELHRAAVASGYVVAGTGK